MLYACNKHSAPTNIMGKKVNPCQTGKVQAMKAQAIQEQRVIQEQAMKERELAMQKWREQVKHEQVNQEFIQACINNDLELVKTLVSDCNADYDKYTYCVNRAKYFSAIHHTKQQEHLLYNYQNKHGIRIAIEMGHNDLVLYLLDLPKTKKKVTGPISQYILNLAFEHCNTAVIQRFMSLPDIKLDDGTITAKYIKMLIDANTTLEQRLTAVEQSKTDAIATLETRLSALENRQAHTPTYTTSDLTQACIARNLGLVKQIIETPPHIRYNYVDDTNMGCLLLACMYGYNNIALYLLSLPDIDYNNIYVVCSHRSINPLLLACYNCDVSVIRRLLEFPDVSTGEKTLISTSTFPYTRGRQIMHVIRTLIRKL